MPVDVAVQTCHSQRRLQAFPIVRRIELFLRKRCEEQPQAIELNRRKNVLEEPVVVVDRNDLSAGDISQFGPVVEEDRRRKFRKKSVRQVEVDIETFEAREHIDLHLRKDLPTIGLQWMG